MFSLSVIFNLKIQQMNLRILMDSEQQQDQEQLSEGENAQ